MKFRTKVILQTAGGMYVRAVHADLARRMCKAQQAKRLTSGCIELLTSMSAVRSQYLPTAPKLDAPPRRHYHEHTSPNCDRKTPPPHFYRSDTGQTGSKRTLSMNLDNLGTGRGQAIASAPFAA